MISQRAVNYAKVLYSKQIKEESIQKTKDLLFSSRELKEALENPAIKNQEKEAVIEKLFDQDIASFVKLLCENNVIGIFTEIMNAYDEIVFDHKNIVRAKLSYVVKPNEEEIEQIKKMVCEKYNKAGVSLELEEDASLIGGYVLYVGNIEYNKSIKGTLSEMQKTLIRR